MFALLPGCTVCCICAASVGAYSAPGRVPGPGRVVLVQLLLLLSLFRPLRRPLRRPLASIKCFWVVFSLVLPYGEYVVGFDALIISAHQRPT